ncbi:ATP-binding protein [Saccharopolyspora indica]|uniref:ATP-binding protein n=1 Tax=Saccharopolyspora indica TaxID=1229659 RepID=UPI0022EB7958|nr:ATP-binding protein [Saccharopolyspora indica]MDA3647042.1 ATP-binding protein [Saccharopolyspora indica]
MTENHSELHEPQGPVHSGSGDLNINPIYVNLHESVTEQARGPRLTLNDDLRWLKRRFVAPPKLDLARSMLLESQTVLMTGPVGSGRRTAAKMLLNELPDDQAPFTVLDDEATDRNETLTKTKILQGHRFVLDLSNSDERVFLDRLRELPAFRTELHRVGAHLIVVAPDSFKHHVDAELDKHTVRIDRPSSAEVLRAHLYAEKIDLPAPLPDDVHSADHMNSSMSEVATFANLVVQARRADPDGDVKSWFRTAVTTRKDRRGEVAEQMQKHWRGRPRAVLLAGAMCRGATSDAVFFASHKLVTQLALDEDEDPRLEQDGYRDQLSELEISVTTSNRIEFSKPSYDQAVREYFWDSYPDLRKQFCFWVDQVIRDPLLTPQNRLDLVDRVVAEALRTSSPGHVRWLIERWVFPTGTARWNQLQDFGVRALILGLTDEQHGWFFRRVVYEWSRNSELPAVVGQILVEVCVEVIAPRFPSQALVRLHHRARREDGQGNPTARQALSALTREDPLLWMLLLDRLAQDVDQDKDWPADLFLFLDLADPWHISGGPQPMVTDAFVRSQLVLCWNKALISAADPVWLRVCDWLAAAAQTSQYDALLWLLVEAAYQNVSLLASLHVVARDWSASPNGRPEAAVRLSQLIDVAQGLHATDYAPMPEEAVR